MTSISAEKVLNLDKSIAAESSIGKHIMSKARALNDNNNNYK
jgi:hypothetical protein